MIRATLLLLLLVLAPPAAAQCNRSLAAVEAYRAALRDPSNASYLDRFGLRVAPDDSIVIVTDTTLCRRAADIISLDLNLRKDRFSLVLGRVRANYVAQTNQPMGAFQEFFVFDSTMSLLLPRDTLVSFSNAPSAPPPDTRCIDAEHSLGLRSKIRGVLTGARQKWYRDLLGLAGISPDSVFHVGNGPTCDRAIATVKRYLKRPDEHVWLALFRVGPFHWGEVALVGSEWPMVFVLDSAATRVVGQH